MELFKPINLPFADILQRYTAEYMKSFNGTLLDVQDVPIPQIELDKINNYLTDRNISKLKNILAFKRKMPYIDHNDCHVDAHANIIVKCSVVIPVSGCKDTKQYWFTGDYVNELRTINGIKYSAILWKNNPIAYGDVEISDSAMLVRTDIPHSAYSRADEPRLTCTIRFLDNEPFEYLSEHLSR